MPRSPTPALVAALALALCWGASHAFAARNRGPRKARPGRVGPSSRSESPRELLSKGVEQLRRRQYSSAISLLERAAQADGGSAEAFYHLGNAYYQRAFQRGGSENADLEDANQAVESYQTALAMDPGLGSVSEPYMLYHGMAMSYEALGKYSEALESLKKAMAVSPDNPMPGLYAARLRYRMRDPARSSDNLHLSVRRSRRLNVYRSLARLVRTDPGFSQMLDVPLNRSILDTYDRVEDGAISEAEARDRIVEMAGMVDSLRDAARSDAPTSWAPPRGEEPAPRGGPDPEVERLLKRAEVDLRYRRFRSALDGFQAALEEDRKRGTLTSAERARILESMGSCHRSLGLTVEAIQSLERAAEESPRYFSPRYQLALAYAVSGQFSKALASLEAAFSRAATPAETRRLLLLSKADPELDAIRDLPAFKKIVEPYSPRPQARPR